MEEIKRRQIAIDLIDPKKYTTPYQYTNWEFIAFQYRMIFELIVLASMASHRQFFERMSGRLATEWKISAVVRAVREKNPNFFPHPIKRVPSSNPHVLVQG
jgi:hypothetical protein